MQPSKGINQDIHPNDLPEGFYSYARNILCSPITNNTENEPGFDESLINSNPTYVALLAEGMRIIGTLSTTKFVILWLTNNTKSIVGTFNSDTDTFSIVYDDTTKPKLKLNLDYPIKAVWRENFLGEIYTAWTDRFNKPKILNIQKASTVNNEKDLLLFTEFLPPVIDFEILTNGGLKTGTYYGYIQYETTDGKVTDYSSASFPIYIGPDSQEAGPYNFFGSGSATVSKKILFKISNIDLSYDKINFAVQRINSGNNTKSFVKVSTVAISGRSSIEFSYTGSEKTDTLTSEDVLVKAPSYSKVQAITTLDSQLFFGNLTTGPSVNIQKFINNWKVKWVSDLVEYPSTTSKLPKYSSPKSFAHDEVYALYAVLEYKSGKRSQAFMIPGREMSTITVDGKTFNENAVIKATDNLPTQVGYTAGTSYLTEDFELSTGNVKYFQTRDTCTWETTSGKLGYWENANEEYPPTSDWEVWNATGKIGTLENKKVRHHKFPSNSFVKKTIFNEDSQYGMTKIDKLGIKLEDVYLPAEIASTVHKIIICQAKRDFNNSLVVAQDKTMFMGVMQNQTDQSPNPDGAYNDFVVWEDAWGTLPVSSIVRRYYNTSGGDAGRRSYMLFDIDGFRPVSGIPPEYYRLKLHAPEILNIQPNLQSTYLKLNYRVKKRTEISFDTIHNSPPVYQNVYLGVTCTSSTEGGSTSISEGKKIIRVLNNKYTSHNVTNPSGGGNPHTEYLRFSEQGAIIDIPKYKFDWSGAGENLGYTAFDVVSQISPFIALPAISCPSTIDDYYYHYNINKFKDNVYTSFFDQSILVVGGVNYQTISPSVFNGDVFLDLYSFKSFSGIPWGGDNDQQQLNDGDYSIRSSHTIFTETSINSGLRYSTHVSNEFYRGDLGYLRNPDSFLLNGNFIGTNPDYNQVNESVEVPIFEDSLNFTDSFPHRIVQSLAITSESKVQQWSTFLPLDYYEIDKSKGVITNLQSMRDRLLIHTERALFQTKGRSVMSTDEGAVNLTSGKLFEFDPIEINPTTNGYTGTQHMFSCNLFKDGYYWVDAQQGKVFCFNGESLKELSQEGLNYFFVDNLGKFPDNPHNGQGISMLEDIKNNRVLMFFKTPNNNFTWSYSNILNKGAWISSHSYVADCAFSTRNNIFSFKDGKLYKHNSLVNKGLYYLPSKESSYIDVTFNPYNILTTDTKTGKRVFKDDSIYLNTVSWNTDLIANNTASKLYNTFTHITVWNQYQHSSRITLDYNDLLFTSNNNSRNAETNWTTNTFRDLVKDKALPFIQDIFNNFMEINSNIDPAIPWYEQERFNNRWFTVRFEYDNSENNKLVIHSLEVNKTDSYR
jgi:hypothetical protein